MKGNNKAGLETLDIFAKPKLQLLIVFILVKS